MRLVSWNCRGLGNPSKAEAVENLLKSELPEILMHQETKIEGEALLKLSKGKWKTKVGKAVSAKGTCGRIATLWEADKFQLESSFQTQHWIYTELRHLSSKINFALFNLYVPVLYAKKEKCWQTLTDFLEAYSLKNIIIAGDFNLILDPKEKRGGTSSRDRFLSLVENRIQQWDLLDFKLKKGLYTWTNNIIGEEHISAKLDRFLLLSSFLSKKMIISTKILPKWNSDYKPILLLMEEEENLGPIPFWFSTLWANREGYMDTVNKAWSIHVLGSPSYVWEQKIKATKTALKQWIKKPTDSPTTQRKQSTKQLLDLQMGLEMQDITSAKIHSEQEHQISTLQTFKEEKEYLRLKSCNLWLASGDKNTAFFHKQIRTCLSRNHIAEIISPNGVV